MDGQEGFLPLFRHILHGESYIYSTVRVANRTI